jgi:hypothetical protein
MLKPRGRGKGAERCCYVGDALRPCALAWLRKRKPASVPGSFIALPAPLFDTTSLNIQRLPLKCGRGVTGPPTPRLTRRGVVSRTRLPKPRRLLVGRSSKWPLSGPGVSRHGTSVRVLEIGCLKMNWALGPPLPSWERSDRIGDAIRVRGCDLSRDLNPSPQPPPTSKGRGSSPPLPSYRSFNSGIASPTLPTTETTQNAV